MSLICVWVRVTSLGSSMTLHFVNHGANDIILVCQFFSEREKVHYAVAKEANQAHGHSEPSVRHLIIYTCLNDLEDETCCALVDIIYREGL